MSVRLSPPGGLVAPTDQNGEAPRERVNSAEPSTSSSSSIASSSFPSTRAPRVTPAAQPATGWPNLIPARQPTAAMPIAATSSQIELQLERQSNSAPPNLRVRVL